MAASIRSTSTAGSSFETASVPCATCRKRRVKCDKRLPGCIRCEKSNQPCPGYNRLRSFLDQGEALRQKYAEPSPKSKARREAKVAADQSTPQTVYQYQSTSTSQRSSPPHLPSAQTTPQLANPATSATGHYVPSFLDPAAQPDTAAHHDALSSYMSIDSLSEIEFENTFFDIDPNIYFAEGNNCCGWIPNAPLLNEMPDAQAPTISWLDQITPGNFSDASPYPDTAMTSVATSESDGGSVAGDEYETGPLVQHFSENISPYLDVFDIEKYFGHVVPVKARRSDLLTNSLAAIAAKQFAKTKRDKPNFNTPGASNPFLDQFTTDASVDWFYKAASFYDKAIVQMMSSLQGLRDGVMDAPSPAPGAQSPDASRGKRAPEKVRTPASVLDDLLAAVSIFLLYESLDNRQLEINQHMSGAQFLLTKNIPGLENYQQNLQSPPLRSFDTVKAWQATFWNVVRIDYVVSYVERTHPRINTDDIYLWQAAGLPLREVDGSQVPESLVTGRGHPYSTSGAPMTETAACRTLLWLVLKALTYAAEERDASRTMQFTPGTQGPLTTNPITDSRSWFVLRENLEFWHKSLPDSFEPYLRLQPGMQRHTSQAATPAMSEASGTGSDSSSTVIQFPTLHYSNPMASTAMVLYHFTQLFLLLHKPQPTSTSSDTFSRYATKMLNSYRQVSREIDDHANKLCGVALAKGGNGNEDGSLGMHLVQPLHLAGLTLEPNAGEKKVVIEGLLKGIQRTTGCSTEWILTSLREEWGWSDVVR